MSFICK